MMVVGPNAVAVGVVRRRRRAVVGRIQPVAAASVCAAVPVAADVCGALRRLPMKCMVCRAQMPAGGTGGDGGDAIVSAVPAGVAGGADGTHACACDGEPASDARPAEV